MIKIKSIKYMLLSFILIACGKNDKSNKDIITDKNQEITDEENDPLVFEYPKDEAAEYVKQWLDSSKLHVDLPKINNEFFHKDIFTIYAKYNFTTVWKRKNAQELLQVIKNIDKEGLNPESYPIEDLQWLYNQALNGTTGESGARLDLLLSLTYLKVADVIATGKVKPGKYNSSWHIKPDKPDELYLQLEKAINGSVNQSLDYFRPQYPQYKKLMNEIDRYSGIIENGDWPKVGEGKNIHPGDSGKRINDIKNRLYLSGDLKISPEKWSDPYSYDDEMLPAVHRFQHRHGLTESDVITDAMINSLNVSAGMRQKQIMLNLDRIRWFASGDMPATYVLVNIPEYRLHVVENKKLIKTMKVVVGEVMNTTPVFSDYIEYAVFSPYWNVPKSITKEEIWPQASNNPGYLKRNNYEVLNGWSETAKVIPPSEIEWDSLEEKNYRIRQKPGPWNALGRVKYMFPNDFAIYLHDTPADQLFDKQHRAFSHGCIRIEDPVWFGDWLFDQYNSEEVHWKMTNGERDIVPVDDHVPVFILYLTTFIDQDGVLNFRKDLYELDKELAQEFEKV